MIEAGEAGLHVHVHVQCNYVIFVMAINLHVLC